MKISKTHALIGLAATSILCAAAIAPAQALPLDQRGVSSTQASATQALRITDSLSDRTLPNVDPGYVGSSIMITNGSGEPLSFTYDSDGSGHGANMNWINADGTPVAPNSERMLAPGETGTFFIETVIYGTAGGGSGAALQNDDGEQADLYPHGLWSHKYNKTIHVTSHADHVPGTDSDPSESWITANFTQGDAHAFAESYTHVDGNHLWADRGATSLGLGIMGAPLVIPPVS